MSKLELLKKAAGIVVSVGVGAIVGNAITSTTPDTAGTIKKVCIGIGAFVLSSMITDKVSEYAENKIDEAVAQIKGAAVESVETT
ncbi:MAG: hypothetical protein N2317_08610 [Syntrophales bacterium]|nr:hypothetical protein [Syntrophales bacterium]